MIQTVPQMDYYLDSLDVVDAKDLGSLDAKVVELVVALFLKVVEFDLVNLSGYAAEVDNLCHYRKSIYTQGYIRSPHSYRSQRRETTFLNHRNRSRCDHEYDRCLCSANSALNLHLYLFLSLPPPCFFSKVQGCFSESKLVNLGELKEYLFLLYCLLWVIVLKLYSS